MNPPVEVDDEEPVDEEIEMETPGGFLIIWMQERWNRGTRSYCLCMACEANCSLWRLLERLALDSLLNKTGTRQSYFIKKMSVRLNENRYKNKERRILDFSTPRATRGPQETLSRYATEPVALREGLEEPVAIRDRVKFSGFRVLNFGNGWGRGDSILGRSKTTLEATKEFWKASKARPIIGKP
ncbi:hypothetical protein E3N88_39078 [Mikania micrantha]|uniref:Uncharacterized protein n=1 Tax=Mikania micrantha TaxID=192012 RepID=A0A5N6LVZ7_9ASTR|nr:hypothetical protein E3N88_39078 [Mikania micrantha]